MDYEVVNGHGPFFHHLKTRQEALSLCGARVEKSIAMRFADWNLERPLGRLYCPRCDAIARDEGARLAPQTFPPARRRRAVPEAAKDSAGTTAVLHTPPMGRMPAQPAAGADKR